MKTRLLTIFWLSLCLSGCASIVGGKLPEAIPGKARLVIPATLTTISIDGQKPESTLARPDPYYHFLEPGSHTLELSYWQMWGNNLSGESVRSGIYKLSVDVVADTDVVLQHSDAGSRSPASAEQFIDNFAIWATTADGDRVDAVYDRPAEGLLQSLGAQVGQDSTDTPSVRVPVVVADAANGESSALAQLKYWWQQESKEERAEFLIWSTSQ